ncbi:MAG: ribbon-helix-helix domain-containing protein [Alphaproteobacteria bacterium]|nr:ribbon-helix-helix domain-containing protein [Alphaproteobacteria bacterium]
MLFSRNVKVNGRRTSMRLEGEIWEALEEISERENLTINELCSQIDNMRDDFNLSAATRVFIVAYFRAAASNINHVKSKRIPDFRDDIASRFISA